jgi:hypothetical protein
MGRIQNHVPQMATTGRIGTVRANMSQSMAPIHRRILVSTKLQRHVVQNRHDIFFHRPAG